MLEAPPEELEAKNRMIYVKSDPARAVHTDDVTLRFHARRKNPLRARGYFDPATTREAPIPTWSYIAQAVEVEVDIRTGEVTVLKVVTAQDAGRIVNLTGAEGQVDGSICQGLGYVSLEELNWNKGRTMNPNLLNYKIHTALDMPKEVNSSFVETLDPAGPTNVKGLGEVVIVPTAPAFANAIANAIKIRIRELPVKYEKILEALKKI